MIPFLTEIPLPEAKLLYAESFFTEEEANKFFLQLRNETPWRGDKIKVFGKTYDQPRLTALYATNGKTYSYSGIQMKPLIFSPLIAFLAEKIYEISGIQFTTCLLNLYRNGQDSNGWHSDDEKELGINPPIASLSFGATRKFKLRKKDDHQQKLDIDLKHGSLLLMLDETQHTWQHQIPKTKKEVGERINLTFRIIE